MMAPANIRSGRILPRLASLATSLFILAACTTTTWAESAGASADGPAAWSADAATRFIWPGKSPGWQRLSTERVVTERSEPPALRDRYMLGITEPELYLFPARNPNGTAMLVIPGGGYRWVVMDKEGFELGEWLAQRNISAFVLMYRLPGENWEAGPDTTLQDTQRAMRWIRRHSAEFAIDPHKVGVIGFSAGGHAAADLATRYDETVYAPEDAADELSARPDFAALVYPVISMQDGLAHAGSREHLLGRGYTEADIIAHSPDQNVHAGMPPVFLLHAADDVSVPVGNSLAMHAALRDAGVPAELHVYPDGSHGFGLRYIAGTSVARWPELLHDWISLQTSENR
jgi:acetyl esterase/lipase